MKLLTLIFSNLLIITNVFAAPENFRYNLKWGHHTQNSIRLEQEKISGNNIWTVAMWEELSPPRLLGKRPITESFAKKYEEQMRSMAKKASEVKPLGCGSPIILSKSDNKRTLRLYACSETASPGLKKELADLSANVGYLLNLQ